MVQDSIDFGRRLSVRSEPEDQETNLPVAMETDGPEGTLEVGLLFLLPIGRVPPIKYQSETEDRRPLSRF